MVSLNVKPSEALEGTVPHGGALPKGRPVITKFTSINIPKTMSASVCSSIDTFELQFR